MRQRAGIVRVRVGDGRWQRAGQPQQQTGQRDVQRRLANSADIYSFLTCYFPDVFWGDWTEQRREMVAAILNAAKYGGDQAIAALEQAAAESAARRLAKTDLTYFRPFAQGIVKGDSEDVAALPDKFGGFDGSCGRCYEVQCHNSQFRDAFGENIDRASQCKDSSASLVVRTTDACPCVKDDNPYSNSRWCCGDMNHVDLSIWAFEKLADPKLGVIAIEWRDVSCKQAPTKAAKNPWGQKSTMHYQAPGGWNSNMDKRPEGNYLGRKMAL
jgi:hypothetical protein